jgi:hypothetical protein
MPDNVTMTAVDGTDALAFVIIRPGSEDGAVAIEAAANGLSEEAAAHVLRTVANMWDPQSPVELATRAQKLVDGWKQASGDHARYAKSRVMDEMPGMADRQEGRSLSLLDCADELADVLKGDDPDDWEHGVGMDVLDRDERDTEAQDQQPPTEG